MNLKVEITHEGKTFFGEIELDDRKSVPQTPPGTSEVFIKPRAIKKPSAAVDLLYRKKFFLDPHSLAETWSELRKEGFNFSRPAVLMALKAANYLTMSGKRGSYRFVQKFPALDE